MSLSLPDHLREFVEAQVQKGGYVDATEYLCELVREAERREAKHDLEQKLLAGIRSGEATEMTPADWEAIRAEVRRRHAEPARK